MIHHYWTSCLLSSLWILCCYPTTVPAHEADDDNIRMDFVEETKENMNGEYTISSTPNAPKSGGRFPTQYKDYPREIDYFDVYSPDITTFYSQVFWKGLPAVDLPKEIVERYTNEKVMAVVGFELNQVRVNDQGQEVTIPYTAAYNHHFESNMIGGSARFERIIGRGTKTVGHGTPFESYIAIPDDRETDDSIPTTQAFGAANGGEARNSFHGYAPGYAQLIREPRQIQITPMQIDTWHRTKMDLDDPDVAFVSGPVPRNSLAPTTGPDAIYSGLLECPLTTRVERHVDASYRCANNGTCTVVVNDAAECFIAATKVLEGFGTSDVVDGGNVSDANAPRGCVAVANASSGQVIVSFNTLPTARETCGPITKSGTYVGSARSLVRVDLELNASYATITLRGPSDVWFGVGFGASAMKDRPWTLIVDGEGNVTERRLHDQNPGDLLSPSIEVLSTRVVDGNEREVVVRRDHVGAIFTFDPNVATIPIINAIGAGPTLAYHKDKTPAVLSVLPTESGACVCAKPPAPFGSATGSLVYHPVANQSSDVGSGTVSFGNTCAPRPRTDLLAMRNPTCDLRTYVGGQTSCHHMWSLLDADQDIPWTDRPLTYRLKFRFWYQDYNASYHRNVKRTTWGIASPVEYDVPKCAANVEGCALVNGTWIHTITGTFQGNGKLVAAHFHCHAPTCLSVSLYRNDTGELLCREVPVYGLNEPGFISQPPCLWGSETPESFGLETPPDVNGVALHAIKTSNATHGHHGEMAWLQMFHV